MSWAAAVAASVATTAAGVKWVAAKRNEKKDQKNRPQYEIPDEVKQNLSAAQQDALQGLPEEQKQQYLASVQRGSAQALAGGGSRKGGLVGIQSLNQQQNDSYGNLLAMDSQARMANKQNLYAQRQNMADYRDQAFQFNKVNPYYEHIKAREERNNALAQGVTDGAAMYGSSAGGGMMGGGKGKSSQFGKQGQEGNMYNYNPKSNPQGIVPDGKQYPNDYA